MKKTGNKSPGRPRTSGIKLPIFESISQAAGVTGIPTKVFRDAKRQGCPAFKSGNRIDLAEFLRWHWANLAAGEALDANAELARLRKAQADEKERENALASGQVHSLEQIESILWENGLSQLRAMILDWNKRYRQ